LANEVVKEMAELLSLVILQLTFVEEFMSEIKEIVVHNIKKDQGGKKI